MVRRLDRKRAILVAPSDAAVAQLTRLAEPLRLRAAARLILAGRARRAPPLRVCVVVSRPRTADRRKTTASPT